MEATAMKSPKLTMILLLLSAQILLTPVVRAAASPDTAAGAIALPVPEAPALPATAQDLLAEVGKRVSPIHTEDLRALLKAHPETTVIDVRAPVELALQGGHIDAPRFFNLERGRLEFQIGSYITDKNTPIVVYSGFNQRSPLAADTLVRLGYANVRNYSDGFFAWRSAGLPVRFLDKAPDSFLYSMPEEVIPGVWSAIGATAPGTYENSGHNNNLSFIITEDGVVVVNAGDSYLLAQSLHEEIRKRTSQPVKYVVLENSQGHAMHGSNYWKAQGATIIAHADAAREIARNGYETLAVMRSRQRDKAFKTELTLPDKIIEDRLDLNMGSWKIQVLRLGPSHSHGDLMVWLPEKKLVISGDTAFHVRMLPVFEDTDTAKWIETWDKFEALGAEIVIPGHGGPTDMPTVTRWTRDYLVYLRARIAEVIAAGGTLDDAYKIDQSPYLHLHTSDELAKVNAGRVFRAMEFE
jgi:glyoxylase-like metal-dependent hydrolase (beta-lactamase superfamily II)/rhodanese-related sulfurtransferase